jgi:hypothetical protein
MFTYYKLTKTQQKTKKTDKLTTDSVKMNMLGTDLNILCVTYVIITII